MRVSVFACAVCLVASPSLGWADPAPASAPDVVATNAGASGAASQPAASDLTRWLSQAPPVGLGNDDPDAVIMLGPDRAVHGEVSVGVGTGGYRDVLAAVSLPVGQTGRLGVAVEDSQYGRPWRSEQRSLNVDLSLGGASAAPADCGSAIHVGDRYVEPLWVARVRGSALKDADLQCGAAAPPPR